MADAYGKYQRAVSDPATALEVVDIAGGNFTPTSVGRALYVGGTGDVVVDTPDSTNVKLASVPAGAILPVRVTRVYAAAGGTTASLMVVLA
ncbi:MAG: hypothetical protein NT029_08250 [Armatimonadetes bacterium]|nr:hypothetical protein [Armatimonadota bacterium]